MFRIFSLATLRLLALVAQPGLAAASDVMLTSEGAVQKPALMRRHSEEMELPEDELQHHHKSGSAKAMFIALDLNGDGLVSGHEIKVSMKQAKFAIPQTLHNIMRDVDDTTDGGISFTQFHGAAKEAEEKHALHLKETHRHHAIMVEHKAKIATQTAVTTQSAWVTCGGAKAPTCDACPKTDDAGRTVFDHGSEWCNADCAYSQGKCLPKGSVTVSGTSQGASKDHSATAVPDLLNKAITPMDAEVITNAAGDAIKEENVEAAEKQQKQEEAEEGKKFSWGKFWLVVIITFSVILGICAIVSIVSLVVFCLMGQKRSGKGEDEEGEAFAEGEGEGEAEAVDATTAS